MPGNVSRWCEKPRCRPTGADPDPVDQTSTSLLNLLHCSFTFPAALTVVCVEPRTAHVLWPNNKNHFSRKIECPSIRQRQ